MGFSSVGASIASTTLSNAIGLLSDFSGIVSMVFAAGVLALLVGALFRFLPR